MKYISLPAFLSIFSGKNSRTFQEFIENAQVKSGNKIVSLKSYIKMRNISNTDIHVLYDHIINRNEYLTRFYNTSLSVSSHSTVSSDPISHMHIAERPMPRNHLDNNTLVNYKNVIRNIHFRNILQKTKSGFDNVPAFLNVLLDLYLREIVDYKILTPSAMHYSRNGRIGSVFSSFYFRASILNPYLVYSLNHTVLKGERIFTPTLGWSSYAYGFLECSHTKEYVGTDVIADVCKKTAEFCDLYGRTVKSEIFCEPSEDLLHNARFMKRYRSHFDVVFFSPPYYELELYPGANQSTRRYKTYDEWLDGYWRATMRLCYYVLEKGGKMCYILSSGGGKDETNILQDMNRIAREFFSLTKTLPMYNKNVHVTAGSHRETSEKIVIFTK